MDKFEEYIAYVGKTPKMDKEQIKKAFEAWLDNPLTNCGFFCVRWIEDDDLSNVITFKDFSEKVTRPYF